MNSLPQDLIRIIRSYDRHPCGEMLSNSITIICGTEQVITSKGRRITIADWRTRGDFALRDDSTEEDEDEYESEVVERTTHTKLKLRRVDEDTFEHLKNT